MVQMTNLSWGMLNLRLVRKISGFFGGGLSISQPGGRMRKKNQQRKLKEQAAGVTEEVGQCTMAEDKERTATGFDNLESQVTFRKASVVKWWA